jgi:iron complex outermembrane receptor protein
MPKRLVTLLAPIAVLLGAHTAHAQTVAGRITDAASQAPLPGARVRVLAADGAVVDSALSTAAGTYRIGSVAPGRYVIAVALLRYAAARDTVQVAAGETVTRDFALSGAASVLDQVVVTASRRAERAQEAPASVSVVGAREIEARPAVTPADHLRNAPGVDIAQNGIINSNVVVRGFNAAFSSALSLLTDYRIAAVPGLQVNRFGMLGLANDDIDRMEVVLGPAAALYGPNTANGVVHVITRSPLASQGSAVSVTGGERGAVLGSFRTAQKVTENLGVKLSGTYFRADEWPFADTAEVRLRGVAQTRLGAFQAAQAALGRTPDQISDSVAADPALFALTRVGVRRDDARRYGVDGRADWRPSPGVLTVVQVGQSSNTSTDLTGISASAQDDYKTTYYQVRTSAGRFFGQAYMEQGDAGGTYTTRTGEPVVDKSKLWVGQLQYGGSMFGGRQDLTAGIDLLHTDPVSGGTVYGRNEDDDKITQTGAYLQSETRLTRWLRLVLAGRGDYHSVLEQSIFSPRAGLVFEPTREHSFRATYNRAFQAPTAINLYLDRLSSRTGPYAVRAVAPGVQGYNFRLPDDQLAIRSPFNPAAAGGAATRVAYTPQGVSRYAINYLVATGQITPAEAGRLFAANPNFAVLGRNPQTGRMAAFDPAGVQNVGGIDNELSEVFEVGYKGLVGGRMQIGVDLWRMERSNFISQLYAPAPLLLVRGQDVAAFLIANGIAPARAATLATNAASTPMGVVAAAETDAYTDGVPILITYKNYADVDLNGADFNLQLLLGNWRVRGAASLLADNYFSFGADEQPVALNAPKRKGSVALGYDGPAITGEVRARHTGGFPVYSGVYVGNSCAEPEGQGLGSCVKSATLADLTLGYRFARGASVIGTVTNLFDKPYQGFAGVPEIGRLALIQLRQEF